MDIARDVMGLGDTFDPSNDAHVRIEVSRLRTALAAFYSRLTSPRPRILTIPKGGYRVEATLLSTQLEAGPNLASLNDPVICLGILCTQDELSCRFGFELECELLNMISTSTLTADHLLKFSYASGQNIEQLATQAERNGADILTVAHVSVTESAAQAFVTILRPWDRRLLKTVKLSAVSGASTHLSDLQWISQGIATEILDPISGCAMKALYQARPNSRLSALSKVFEFMGSQDRDLLPDAYSAARQISQTSDVAKALSIDMRRASYCFATDCNIQDLDGLCDAADDLVHRAPDNAWANLAMGYAGIAGGQKTFIHRALPKAARSQLLGAQKDDYDLLQALAGKNDAISKHHLRTQSKENLSIFDTISLGIAAVGNCGDEAETDAIVQSKHSRVFWVQAMQIAVQVQRNQLKTARENYCIMKQTHPGVETYSKRAFETMIPNTEVKDRILEGLAVAAP